MKKLSIIVAFAVLSTFQASSLYAGEKFGKLFIKASSTTVTVDGQQFSNKDMEESVNHLKERAGKFVVVDSEKEADYLLVLVKRNKNASKEIELVATISFKQNGQWKPGAILEASSFGAGMAARKIMGKANDWAGDQGE